MRGVLEALAEDLRILRGFDLMGVSFVAIITDG